MSRSVLAPSSGGRVNIHHHASASRTHHEASLIISNDTQPHGTRQSPLRSFWPVMAAVGIAVKGAPGGAPGAGAYTMVWPKPGMSAVVHQMGHDQHNDQRREDREDYY